MPNVNELSAAITAALCGVEDNVKMDIANAIMSSVRGANPCGSVASTLPRVEYNKDRTIYKDRNTAGFSDESLTVTVKTVGDHDVLIINAANKFARYYNEVPGKPGFHFDRGTLRCQLRLGVLKISGRTYKTSTPVALMNLRTKTIVPVMKPNKG